MIGIGMSASNSNYFDPKSISNLYAWYDASNSASITRSGFGAGTATQVNDLSANAYHLTTQTGATNFGYFSAVQNGLNCLRGNGVATGMYNMSVTALYGSSYTIMTASDCFSDNLGDLVATNGIVSGNILLMNQFSGHIRAHNFEATGTASVDSATGVSVNTQRICGQRWTSGTNVLDVILKGAVDATLTQTGITGLAATKIGLGSRLATGNGTANFNGNIYEVLIYSASLTTAQIQAIYNYFRNKWNITT